MSTVRGAVSSGSAGGDRLDVEDVERRSRDRAGVQGLEQRVAVDQAGPGRVHEVAARSEQRQLVPADGAAAALGQHQVQADDVRAPEQLGLVAADGARRLGRLVGEVRAPGQDLHAERPRDGHHAAAEVAEAEQAQRAPGQARADRALPPAGAQRRVLEGHRAQQPEQQRPRQLGRRGRGAGHPADRHAAPAGGRQVHGGVAHAARDDEPQVGQALEHRRRQGRALAHEDHRVGAREPGDHGVAVLEPRRLERHGPPGQRGPVRQLRGHPLVVVQHDRTQLLHPRTVGGRT